MAEWIEFHEHAAVGGVIGEIVLQRPDALNALSLTMLKSMSEHLLCWQNDDRVKAVWIKSSSARAFCAGGDIRALYAQKHQPLEELLTFFACEYRLNKLLHHFTKPYIAFLDGITFGGGVGISIHGSHVVAAENLSWAMPETKIGFFPDVGASYYLSRCPEAVGWYLALSGDAIDVAAACELGLVTHYVPRARWQELQDALLTIDFKPHQRDVVDDIVASCAEPPAASSLSEHYPAIRRCFNHNSVTDIMAALDFEGSDWCLELLQNLQLRSPMSLCIAFEQLHRVSNMEFDAVMQQDFDLVAHFLNDGNFFTGIHTAVIDKQLSPQWQPQALDDIDYNAVADYFTPLSRLQQACRQL